MKAIRYTGYGDPDVLDLVDVDDPEPGPDEVLVRVVTSGVNPGEDSIRSGAAKNMFPAHFPEGEGSDFAGVVTRVGPNVTTVSHGEAVIGLSDFRSAHAELVALPADHVVRKPDALDWGVAGSLPVVATTAVAMLRSVKLQPDETVVVSGAAGGVGTLVTQLAVRSGARVIAVASQRNHETLRAWGAEPIVYGDDLQERVRAVTAGKVDAVLDTHGDGYVDLALALGVPPDRVDTIIDFAAVQRHGVHGEGMSSLDDPMAAVAEVAESLAAGDLVLPIKARFPLAEIADAYRALGTRHGLGKIVIDVSLP